MGLGGVANLLLLLVCTVQMLKPSFSKTRKTWGSTHPEGRERQCPRQLDN